MYTGERKRARDTWQAKIRSGDIEIIFQFVPHTPSMFCYNADLCVAISSWTDVWTIYSNCERLSQCMSKTSFSWNTLFPPGQLMWEVRVTSSPSAQLWLHDKNETPSSQPIIKLSARVYNSPCAVSITQRGTSNQCSFLRAIVFWDHNTSTRASKRMERSSPSLLRRLLFSPHYLTISVSHRADSRSAWCVMCVSCPAGLDNRPIWIEKQSSSETNEDLSE